MDRREATPCYHCGDSCPDMSHQQDGHVFCCHGCQTVYGILKEGGLSHFYEGEGAAGTKVDDLVSGQYAYLDEPSIQEKLLRFKSDEQAKISLHLPSIHCSSCLWLLENLHRMEEGIIAVKVDFAKRSALISYRPQRMQLSALAELLHRIGYPPHISLADDSLADSQQRRADRSLIIRIGVIGFLFGNIMLLSFPEYLSTGQDLIEGYQSFFSILIALLSLPVLFYGAAPYFRSSWAALSQRRLVIDVPIALGISVIFLRSMYEIISGSGPGYLDSMAGLVFFLLIGKWYQAKVYDRLSFDKDFSSYFPLAVTRWTSHEAKSVPIMDLRQGDVISILHQGIIPADCTLMSAPIEVDYSFVTGESRPVLVQKGERVYAGGKNLSAMSRFEVERAVSQSYLTELWNQPEFDKETPSLSTLLDKASARFTVVVLGIAVLTGIFWAWYDPSILMDAVTAVLIVACPCALALSVPFALGNVRRIIGKAGFFSRSTQVLETMAQVDTIVMDKTGTLTMPGAEQLEYEGEVLTASQQSAVYSICGQSAHPHSRAIHQYLKGAAERAVLDFKEVTGAGIEAKVDGHHYRIGSRDFCEANAVDELLEGSESLISLDGNVIGRFRFHRELRPGVRSLLKDLGQGYRCILLSGDNSAEAAMFKDLFQPGDMHFQMSPQDKMDHVSRLQQEGATVMMLGDGLNDAGALVQADVGVAVSDQTDLFTPACDVIMEGRLLGQLDKLLDYVKKGRSVVYRSMFFSILYNVVGVGIAVQGLLTPLMAAILMPLSSVTIVVFATLSTRYLYARSGIDPSAISPISLNDSELSSNSKVIRDRA